ncbi:hypothetical protein KIN20_021889 [Parelaphostrongylus tenuis]|uniref:Sushi domain-containing protein n=1 Tax=Parelaphostrongylus tenuis TaxID=148309 RepID=A0AAD5MTA1_PARTN|nr:hypothetical protein KIN20_021889 [Parelaphostrongylus tenuis]
MGRVSLSATKTVRWLRIVLQHPDHPFQKGKSCSEWAEGYRQLRCDSNGVEPTSCVTPSAINIPIGGKKLVDGLNYECKKNGSDVIMQCIDRDLEWQVESTQWRCTRNGSQVTGCVTAFGSIPTGEMRVVDGSTIMCRDDGNGGATVQCKDKEGRVWDQGIHRFAAVPILPSHENLIGKRNLTQRHILTGF